jgi:hypothetical protein
MAAKSRLHNAIVCLASSGQRDVMAVKGRQYIAIVFAIVSTGNTD